MIDQLQARGNVSMIERGVPCNRLDLPHPTEPTIAVKLPLGIERLTPAIENTSFSSSFFISSWPDPSPSFLISFVRGMLPSPGATSSMTASFSPAPLPPLAATMTCSPALAAFRVAFLSALTFLRSFLSEGLSFEFLLGWRRFPAEKGVADQHGVRGGRINVLGGREGLGHEDLGIEKEREKARTDEAVP
jgi:hypothetical protein